MIVSMFMVLSTTLLFTLNYVICKLIKWKLKDKKNLSKTRRRMLVYAKNTLEGFYEFYIRLFIEVSLELSICVFMEICMKQVDDLVGVVSYFTSVICLILLIVFVVHGYNIISGYIWMFQVSYEFRIKKIYSGYVTDLNTSYLSRALFHIIFVVRRIVYAAILVLPM